MSDKKQISEQELSSLQEALNKVNQSKAVLGDFMTQTHLAQLQVLELENALQEVQKAIEQEYGSISINISTGEYEDLS